MWSFYIYIYIYTPPPPPILILLGILSAAGNRWILPIWTKTPHQQPPLDYTELEKYPLPPQQVFDTAEIPLEYMELTHKKESDL